MLGGIRKVIFDDRDGKVVAVQRRCAVRFQKVIGRKRIFRQFQTFHRLVGQFDGFGERKRYRFPACHIARFAFEFDRLGIVDFHARSIRLHGKLHLHAVVHAFYHGRAFFKRGKSSVYKRHDLRAIGICVGIAVFIGKRYVGKRFRSFTVGDGKSRSNRVFVRFTHRFHRNARFPNTGSRVRLKVRSVISAVHFGKIELDVKVAYRDCEIARDGRSLYHRRKHVLRRADIEPAKLGTRFVRFRRFRNVVVGVLGELPQVRNELVVDFILVAAPHLCRNGQLVVLADHYAFFGIEHIRSTRIDNGHGAFGAFSSYGRGNGRFARADSRQIAADDAHYIAIGTVPNDGIGRVFDSHGKYTFLEQVECNALLVERNAHLGRRRRRLLLATPRSAYADNQAQRKHSTN